MQCNGRLRGKCNTSQHISVELLEEAFMQQLQHDLTFSGSVSCTVRRVSTPDASQDLRQRRARLASRLDRLRDAYLDGVETLVDYKAARQQIQTQLDALDADISKADAASIPDTASALRGAISATLETLRSPDATIAQKYESAQRIIENCYFDKSHMLLTVFYQLSF